MLRIVLIFVLLFIGCESDEPSGSLHLQTDIDTTIARIGDVINLNVTVQNAEDMIVIFPDMNGSESMEIRDKIIISKKNNPYQVDFNIVFWDTGSFVIPEYPVELLKADSTKDLIFRTDSIDIKIISMVAGTEDTNLRPIKDPVPIKTPINWRRWLLAILLLILLLILLGLWRKRIKKRAEDQNDVSDYLCAKEIAIAQLDDLNQLINSDDKTFYLKASFILREFIENQFYIRALEMTTNEIRVFRDDMELGNNNFTGIINILKRSDLAKFAKYEFTLPEKQSDYDWIDKFINQFNDITNN